MFRNLNITLISSRSSIIVGKFNIHRNWLDSTVPFTGSANHELSHVILDNDLVQLNLYPSRGKNTLDLVMVSQNISCLTMYQIPPIAGSDHEGQVLCTDIRARGNCEFSSTHLTTNINFIELQRLLGLVQWPNIFRGVTDINQYVEIFTNILNDSISAASRIWRQRKFDTPDLLKHMMQLILKKHALWRSGKQSGNFTAYRSARNEAKKAIRSYIAAAERSLLQSGNRHKFFKYVNARSANHFIQHPFRYRMETSCAATETLQSC